MPTKPQDTRLPAAAGGGLSGRRSASAPSHGQRVHWGALDVQYGGELGWAAYAEAFGWDAPRSAFERVVSSGPVAPYRSGAFFERELPCLLGVLETLVDLPAVLVVDAYVDLPDEGLGLGALLFEHIEGRAAVIGVSKTSIAGDNYSVRVCRGQSNSPLFVTAVGMPLAEAQLAVEAMHGRFRLPELLKRVDRMARDAALAHRMDAEGADRE